MQIHVIQNGEQAGPYSQAQFEELLQQGAFGGDDLYWYDGAEGWLPISQHPDFRPSFAVVVPPLPPPPPRPAPPRRVVQLAGPLNLCPSCGQGVAKSATSCPNCGGRLRMGCLPKLTMGVGALVALYLVLGLLHAVLWKATPQAQRVSPTIADAPLQRPQTRRVPPAVADAPSQHPQAVVTPLPGAETAFLDTVQSYISRYSAADNELQKSALRIERRKALSGTVKDLRVSGWVGTLKKLETLSDGRASFSIQLEGSAISVLTTIGNPFDAASSTLLEHGSALYNKVASLSVGDRVTFSGSFLPDEQDYLKETSFTESGSMTAPEFALRFSKVEVASADLSIQPRTARTPTVADATPSVALPPVPGASPTADPTPAPVTAAQETESSPGPTGSPPPNTRLPKAETAFIATVNSYMSLYAAGRNELRKTALRTERARSLKSLLPDLRVTGWVGTIKQMRTMTEGAAFVTIELEGSSIILRNTPGNPFDPASDTSINPHTPVYRGFSALSVGDEVTFSGSFLPGDVDYLKENSFTEAGTMAAPDFVLRFSEVAPVHPPGSTSLDGTQPDPTRPQNQREVGSPPPVRRAEPLGTPVSRSPGVILEGAGGSSPVGDGPPVAEALLVGRWQGARHLTEYCADHTRVMDGVNVNPPRTWHLDGDRLTEEPGKSVYKVVALDQNQLVLEGDGGRRYVHQRVQTPVVNGAGNPPVAGANYPLYLQVNKPALTPTAAPPIRLKVFEDQARTCRLLFPEDGWIPMEPTPRGARLALEGPGGTRVSVRPLDGVVGDRSLAILFARATKEPFPFDDVEIQPTKPEDHKTVGKRTVREFSAEVRDHFEHSVEAMPDGPTKQGMLAGVGTAGSKESHFIYWAVISEGSATWVVETQATFSGKSSAEIKGRMDQSPYALIREDRKRILPWDNDYSRRFLFWKGFAFGGLQWFIADGSFDADGLTPVINMDKQAADAKSTQNWNIFMDVAAW